MSIVEDKLNEARSRRVALGVASGGGSAASAAARNVPHTRRYRARLRALVVQAKIGGCIRCGEDDPVCLDFHHRDPSQKVMPVAEAAHCGLPTLLAEIAKCDVLCANCHRKEHRN